MTGSRGFGNPTGGKVTAYTLLLNYLPVTYLATGVATTWAVDGTIARWVMAVSWIYVVPPIVCRVTVLVFGYPHARGVRQDAREYKVWWFLTQWQVVFNRLPLLEELLRFIPGLYAAWLNLWGARVSPFAYWGPGSRILDRYMARIERGAVIGTQVAISGHIGTIAEDGSFVMDIAPVTVGEGAIIGAMAGLGPGSRVAPHELFPAGRLLQPFYLWQEGRKVRDGGAGK